MKNCLICQSQGNLFCNTDSKKVYKCIQCGFGWVEGVNIQTGDYHRDDTYIQEENLFKNIFQKRIKNILRFKKSGDVLEVGCATGLMLSLLKEKGFSVFGNEISKKTAHEAQKRGIEVTTTPFEKIDPQKKQYDLIIFNHTLEHLEDPERVLKKVYKMLKKDGLVYIDLPNFDSFSAKTQKCNWPLLLPDEHLWQFTPNAFQILLNRQNFEVIFTDKSSGIWDFEDPVRELLTAFMGGKKRFFSEFLTAVPCFILTKLGKGSGLTVIARKM